VLYIVGESSCIDNPIVSRHGTHKTNGGLQMIIPNASISCTCRITGIAVSMGFSGSFIDEFPTIQIWRPSSPGSTVYSNIAQVQLSSGIAVGVPRYHLSNISTNFPMDFQSGDVVGYYQPPPARQLVWNIETSGYTSYSNNADSPATTINISDVDNVDNDRQPLIELLYGK